MQLKRKLGKSLLFFQMMSKLNSQTSIGRDLKL